MKSGPKKTLFTPSILNNCLARGERNAAAGVGKSMVLVSRTGFPGINFKLLGFGVSCVWINMCLTVLHKVAGSGKSGLCTNWCRSCFLMVYGFIIGQNLFKSSLGTPEPGFRASDEALADPARTRSAEPVQGEPPSAGRNTQRQGRGRTQRLSKGHFSPPQRGMWGGWPLC